MAIRISALVLTVFIVAVYVPVYSSASQCYECEWDKRASPFSCKAELQPEFKHTCTGADDVCFTTVIYDNNQPTSVQRDCEAKSTCTDGSDPITGNKTCCASDLCNDDLFGEEDAIKCFHCTYESGKSDSNSCKGPALTNTNIIVDCPTNYQCKTVTTKDDEGAVTKIERSCKAACINTTSTVCCDWDLCPVKEKDGGDGGASSLTFTVTTMLMMLGLSRII